jgi:acyl-CoA synthetase (AMP-forming)/AMP-acid ligase II
VNLLDLIKPHASSRPESQALLAPGYRPISFRRLWDQIINIGSQLNQFGIGHGDRVALVLPNGPEMATAFLATGAFATCAPLNPAFRKSEYEFYLDDLKPKAIIIEGNTNHPSVEVAESRGILVLDLTSGEKNEAGLFDIAPRGGSMDLKPAQTGGPAQENDTALILHTSGTTSGQKAVPLTHQNICASAKNIAHSLELTSEDRCLNVMPLFHIHGLIAGLLSSLAAGGSIICPPGFVAPAFFDWLSAFDPTWYTAVPTMHQAVLARPELHSQSFEHSRLRFIRSIASTSRIKP